MKHTNEVINHINGNPRKNNLSNLEVIFQEANHQNGPTIENSDNVINEDTRKELSKWTTELSKSKLYT